MIFYPSFCDIFTKKMDHNWVESYIANPLHTRGALGLKRPDKEWKLSSALAFQYGRHDESRIPQNPLAAIRNGKLKVRYHLDKECLHLKDTEAPTAKRKCF